MEKTFHYFPDARIQSTIITYIINSLVTLEYSKIRVRAIDTNLSLSTEYLFI
jgi:hypothetical protein